MRKYFYLLFRVGGSRAFFIGWGCLYMTNAILLLLCASLSSTFQGSGHFCAAYNMFSLLWMWVQIVNLGCGGSYTIFHWKVRWDFEVTLYDTWITSVKLSFKLLTAWYIIIYWFFTKDYFYLGIKVILHQNNQIVKNLFFKLGRLDWSTVN